MKTLKKKKALIDEYIEAWIHQMLLFRSDKKQKLYFFLLHQ